MARETSKTVRDFHEWLGHATKEEFWAHVVTGTAMNATLVQRAYGLLASSLTNVAMYERMIVDELSRAWNLTEREQGHVRDGMRFDVMWIAGSAKKLSELQGQLEREITTCQGLCYVVAGPRPKRS
jgi:hypothetical protein